MPLVGFNRVEQLSGLSVPEDNVSRENPLFVDFLRKVTGEKRKVGKREALILQKPQKMLLVDRDVSRISCRLLQAACDLRPSEPQPLS